MTSTASTLSLVDLRRDWSLVVTVWARGPGEVFKMARRRHSSEESARADAQAVPGIGYGKWAAVTTRSGDPVVTFGRTGPGSVSA